MINNILGSKTPKKIITERSNGLKTWKQYIQTAISDTGSEQYRIEEFKARSPVTKYEIDEGIHNMQNNDLPDKVRVELIKIICDRYALY